MDRSAGFVHLHNHTEFSMLDGLIRVEDLIQASSDYKMPAVAITDHGNIFCAVEFFDLAMKAGIKPIIGCELYLAKESRIHKDRSEGSPYHLIVLCADEVGYKNLCQLITLGYLEGFYYKPRIDWELLEKYGKGLIGLSACLQGEIPQLLLAGKNKEAEKRFGHYQEVFGKGNFYLELQENGLEEQLKANRSLVELAQKTGGALVCSNDCHYLRPGEDKLQDILICIQNHKKIEDQDRFRIKTDQLYFRSPEEMKHIFRELPQAISNTLEIADKCQFFFEFKKLHLPKIETQGDETVEEKLEVVARTGFEKRLVQLKNKDPKFSEKEAEYRNRFNYELEIIKKTGFASYFLIVEDFIGYARRNKIPVGPGRGSAAGSLVAYSLGITNVDPIRYGLVFERFLNPERKEMPDIDVDLCQQRRAGVIKYVSEKYGGEAYVSQLITFSTMKAKAVIRDVGRVLNLPLKVVDEIAKLIPEHPQEQESLSGLQEEESVLKKALKEEPRLKEKIESDPKLEEMFKYAVQLEGIHRNPGTHAAGMVISDQPITEYMPLYKGSKPNDPVVSHFDMNSVAKLGLAKFDLLGLRNLTMIDQALKLIKENRGVEIDIDEIPLDDPEVYALISKGETAGIFQMESKGMAQLAIRLEPSRIEELIAIIALYRPGPLRSGMVDDFVERRHGRKKIDYLLPQLKEILEETYGVILYQEQVMQIAVKLANYTMGEADKLRKAMGKKDVEVMEAERVPFITRCVAKGLDKSVAEHIFELIKKFAGYGFNKAHSTVYAMIAYQTAYLKAHYPIEYLTALLTSEIGNTDEVVFYLKECESLKIKIEPPHINTSYWQFIIKEGKIIYGLGAIKNLGESAIEEIVKVRDREGVFSSLFDFCERVDLRVVNRRAIESLIKAGAFDGLGATRSQMMAVLDQAMEAGQSLKRSRDQGQADIFQLLGEKGKGKRKGKAVEAEKPRYPEIPEWEIGELLEFEKEVLGHYLSGHPMVSYQDLMQLLGFMSIKEVSNQASGQSVVACGMVSNYKEKIIRNQERMANFILEDLSGKIEVVVFPNVLQASREELKDTSQAVVVKGRLKQEESPNLIAEAVMSLSQALKDYMNTVHLWLGLDQTQEQQLEKLKELIQEFPGKSKLIIHLYYPERGEVVLGIPERFRIRPEPKFLERLKEIFKEKTSRIELKLG